MIPTIRQPPEVFQVWDYYCPKCKSMWSEYRRLYDTSLSVCCGEQVLGVTDRAMFVKLSYGGWRQVLPCDSGPPGVSE